VPAVPAVAGPDTPSDATVEPPAEPPAEAPVAVEAAELAEKESRPDGTAGGAVTP
jgi:hypothetical protein